MCFSLGLKVYEIPFKSVNGVESLSSQTIQSTPLNFTMIDCRLQFSRADLKISGRIISRWENFSRYVLALLLELGARQIRPFVNQSGAMAINNPCRVNSIFLLVFPGDVMKATVVIFQC